MSRNLTVDQLAAIEAKNVKPAVFVFLDWRSGPLYLWSGIGDFSWDSHTWNGVGKFGGISEVEESDKAQANGITLTLNGVPSELIAVALDRTQYRGRTVRVWKALFDVDEETATLIDDPIRTFTGRMDVMTPLDTGTTSSISLSCENILVDLERPRERRYTDRDQQQLHPGDQSFRYTAGLIGKDFPWGRQGS